MADRSPSPGDREQLLEIGVQRDGLCARVIPVGEIDLATAPRLEETLRSVRNDEGVRRVVVDLAGVTFLDSSALHVFFKTAKLATKDGFDFEITRPSDNLRRLFVLTGIDQFVHMVDGDGRRRGR